MLSHLDIEPSYDFSSVATSVTTLQRHLLQLLLLLKGYRNTQKTNKDTSRVGVPNKPTQIDATASRHFFALRLKAGALGNFFSKEPDQKCLMTQLAVLMVFSLKFIHLNM